MELMELTTGFSAARNFDPKNGIPHEQLASTVASKMYCIPK
jgi:hypothetical protein